MEIGKKELLRHRKVTIRLNKHSHNAPYVYNCTLYKVTNDISKYDSHIFHRINSKFLYPCLSPLFRPSILHSFLSFSLPPISFPNHTSSPQTCTLFSCHRLYSLSLFCLSKFLPSSLSTTFFHSINSIPPPIISGTASRGHRYKFFKKRKWKLGQKFFSARAVDLWSELDDSTVSVDNVTAFKRKL